MTERITEYIYSKKDEFIKALASLVAIPSVRGEAAPDAPFGIMPRRALDKMAKLCTDAGLCVRCCENAVVTADYPADGDAALGILAHLDVVPANAANWHSDPFSLTEKDGVLYGRGVMDDKGPAVAALFAVKCVKELGIPLKKGVRLLFGSDEECGSGDLALYRKIEKLPEAVFTPDAGFPVINIEKGIAHSRFKASLNGGSIRSFTGGEIANAVPDTAEAIIENVDISVVCDAVKADDSGAEFNTEPCDGAVRVICKGRSAHASTPDSGINAVTALIRLCCGLPLTEGKQLDILRKLAEMFPVGVNDGTGAGMKTPDGSRVSDEKSGALTCVFSIFRMDKNECCGVLDVRFPTCADLDFVKSSQIAAFDAIGCTLSEFDGSEPHAVDENSDFIQTLLRVYERVEGEKGYCVAIGGGTYVHDIPGGAAFGAERGNTDYHLHGADEWATTDELLKDAVLFAEVIAEICG